MSQEKLMTVLMEPRVTEKTTLVGEHFNQYVFKVVKTASKLDIKKAVELMFQGANVEKVQVLNVKGKRKSSANRSGKRSDWKKAYVTIKSGYDIDFMGG